MNRKELIRSLRELAQELGKDTLTQKDIKESEISTYWVRKHFRTMASAMEAAGLQPSKLARSMVTSDDELLDYLYDLQRRLGQRPTYLDIDREGRFSQRIFFSRFGSLENALSQIKERQVPVEEHAGAPLRPLASSILQAVGDLQDCEKQARALEQTIERLTEENQRLQAELVASEAPERRITDGKLLFVHTSPDFHHSVYGRKVTSIKDTVANMLGRAERSVRISTLQIDMFTSELVALKRRNPELEITVLMRAKPQGDRSGIATRAMSVMKTAGINVHIEQELLHSRMVVIDNKEALVSSADLDFTMMELEFNAGIWTTNSDVVDQAISYFDNILNVRK